LLPQAHTAVAAYDCIRAHC